MKKLVLIAAIAASAAVFADRVNMKSGSVLTGKVLGVQEGVLKVETTDFGAMDIATNLVQSVATDGREAPVPVAEVTRLEKPPEKWHGSVNVAYQSARGNTYENSATILANVNRRWDEDRFNADFGYYYSENGTSKHDRKKSTDRWEIEGQWDHFWAKSFYNCLNGRYEKDDIAGLDYRLRLGGGFGYQWLENEDLFGIGKWSFCQEAGVAWIRTQYAVKASDADDYAASFRYAHHLSYLPIWREGLEFFHNFEYLPQFNDFDLFLSKADVGLTTKLIMDFDLLAKIEWEYNSTPSVGRKKSDTRYIVGLGYKW